MKCKKCGGQLSLSNDIYICENCGAKYSVSDFYEDIDTYLCYVEYDDAGRRTKDSIIAQDIYQKLESRNIKTFYSRISAPDSSVEQFERACHAALHAAKTVLVLGTQKAHFESLLQKYAEYFKGKVVIPVFADMDASEIPKEISAIQALDYNKVGAEADLIKSLLNALGRTEEIDTIQFSDKANKKKKIIISVSAGVIVLLAVLLYIIFGTNLILNRSGSEDTAAQSQAALYDEAMADIEAGRYADAITVLSQLKGYKDSDRQLQVVYEKYGGYYKDDASNTTLHLQTLQNYSASAEITQKIDGKQIQITESSQFQATVLQFEFNDSENNQGTAKITLQNDAIVLSVETETANSDLCFDAANITFRLDEKSDKPFTGQMDADTLLGFVKSKTTMSDLNQRGFDLEFISPLAKNEKSNLYKIKNTEIYLAILQFDMSQTDEPAGTAETAVDDPIVFGVSAPASIVFTDYIGKMNDPVVKDDILYVPDGALCQNYHTLDLGWDVIEKKKIENSTNVCFTSKALIGNEHFEELVDYHCITGSAKREYVAQYPEAVEFAETLESTDAYSIILVSDYNDEFPPVIYKVNKKTFQVEEVDAEQYFSTNEPEYDYEYDYEYESEPEIYTDAYTQADGDTNDSEGFTWMRTPNAWCPICGYGIRVSEISDEGLTCSQCGCVYMPMCNVCNDDAASSIKVRGTNKFRCNRCGAEWTP